MRVRALFVYVGLAVAILLAAAGGHAYAGQIGPATGYLQPGNNLNDLGNKQAALTNLGLQYYADNCAGMHNDGTSDDAAALRSCIAAIPINSNCTGSGTPFSFCTGNGQGTSLAAGATMHLDGKKPYLFASHSTANVAGYVGDNCQIYVPGNMTLETHGAPLTMSSGEQANTGEGMICAGGGNWASNYPGSAGGSPTFIPINSTTPGAQSVTTVTVANASSFHAGDYIYIDCGSNANPGADDQDVLIGWNKVASDGNATTGVIPLAYPMRKAYNPSGPGCGTVGSPTHARIYNWTTEGGTGTPGGNLGPLATNVNLIGDGSKIDPGQQEAIYYMSVVGGRVTGFVLNTPNYDQNGENFLYGNNNHLIEVDHNIVTASGCTGDTNMNAGEFTSSLNKIDFNQVTLTGLPGVGCAGQPVTHEVAFGDSEGDESNAYSYNTATVQPGLVSNESNLGVCEFGANTWGDTFDHTVCNSYGNGFLDTGSSNEGGGSSVTNGHYAAINNGISIQIAGDYVSGNTVDELGTGIGIYLQGAGSATANSNVINYPNQAPTFGAIVLSGLLSSAIGSNVMTCAACSGNGVGIYTGSTSLVGYPISITGNIFSNFATAAGFDPGTINAGTFEGNTGAPDVNSAGSKTPRVNYLNGSPFGPMPACSGLVMTGPGTVDVPSTSNGTGVIGFNPIAIPQNTIGQTGAVVENGPSCGTLDGTGTNGDIIEMSQGSNHNWVHDIGLLCSNATPTAQVVGRLKANGTSGNTAAIEVQMGLCPPDISTDITQAISSAANAAPTTNYSVTNDVLTFSAPATVTIQPANFAGQTLNLRVCQDGTGGRTPTFVPASGTLTLTDTFPTFTTGGGKCGNVSIHYPSTSTAYLDGGAALLN